MPLTRSLSPDTLAPRMAMVADQRAHPVVQTLRRRREEGSQPGARTDGRAFWRSGSRILSTRVSPRSTRSPTGAFTDKPDQPET